MNRASLGRPKEKSGDGSQEGMAWLSKKRKVLEGVEAVLLEAAEVDGPPVEVVTRVSVGDAVVEATVAVQKVRLEVDCS